MSPARATYNERAWAIDLIGHLKILTRQSDRSIKDAGGEQTIVSDGGALFPDVLLFGDRATARILQGWELKMPNTDINDHEFRQNAELKADALGLDSFLLWNVSHARLYVRRVATDSFIVENEWSDLADIADRGSVASNRLRWEKLATNIVGYLNDLFDRGSLEGRQFIEAYRSGGITALIMENSALVEQALSDASNNDARLRAQISLWWNRFREEYSGTSMYRVLAQAVITNWIGKILFAHVLREKDARAMRVSDIEENTTPAQAMELFRQLSEDCNFWTIFSDSIGLLSIPERPWRDLKQFNRLLTDLRVGSVDQTQLGGVLEATVEVAKRKLRGQYPTPVALARLLAKLCVRDIVFDRLLDPCCGSGTIPRAALELKLDAGVPGEDAAAAVFAGDQDPQAAQITAFALAKPSLMNVPLRIFQGDAFSLSPATSMEFRNPIDGVPFAEEFGQFEVIVCNLPFVAQAGRKHYENAIQEVNETLECEGHGLSGRADVAAYLPFSLHPLLVEHGRIGVIITNAWLGTAWGDSFYEALHRYYDLKCVITSGAGRWFQSSDVVANILIMEKKNDPTRPSGAVKFVVLRRPLEGIEDDDDQQITVAQIELGQTQLETLSIREVSPEKLSRFRKYGLGGSAQFVNSDWLLELPLTRLDNHFVVRRGERRGLNAFFYPTGDHGIEPEYIRPLAKSPTDFIRLLGSAAREAFCCSRTEVELQELGHTGALRWIERFRTPANVTKLSRSGIFWYEMNADALTELVMFINYSDRVFVGRLCPPAFVDQRLVRLVPEGDIDVGLGHALLNSAIGIFIIEGLGFGRGLGALDLNKDRIESYMQFLDPTVLCDERSENIKNAFLPLLNRDVLGVADELEQEDRQHFDAVVIDSFDLDVARECIYESLRSLLEIRLTANM